MMNPEEILDIEEIEEPKDLTDLSWVGRAITANNRQIDLIKDFASKEVEKIMACCNRKMEQLGESNDYLTGMASVVMKSHDYSYDNKNMRKYLMPGIGTFRFSVTRESVDSSEYDGWILEVKEAHQADTPDVFKKKVTLSPDKKVIIEHLKHGGIVDGFKLKPKFEKFEFKGE